MRTVAEIKICQFCLIVADGDPGAGDRETQEACKVSAWRLAQNWPGMNVHGTGGEGGFSWSPCDGCGDGDGGDRFPAVVLGPDLPAVVSATPVVVGGIVVATGLPYLAEWERELLEPFPAGPVVGSATVRECDHDRDTCPQCVNMCRPCQVDYGTPDALAAHVASDHPVLGQYDCQHCAREYGH